MTAGKLKPFISVYPHPVGLPFLSLKPETCTIFSFSSPHPAHLSLCLYLVRSIHAIYVSSMLPIIFKNCRVVHAIICIEGVNVFLQYMHCDLLDDLSAIKHYNMCFEGDLIWTVCKVLYMCICVYVYMYMCICVYVYVCICMYIYMYMYVYVCIYVYI